MSALSAVAVWLQPVLLAGLVVGVTAGDPAAPWLALGVLVAPLVALLAPPARLADVNLVARTAVAVAVTLVLAADFVLAADAAALLGAAPWLGVLLAAALALLVPLLPGARRTSAPMLTMAVAALLLPLVSVALTTRTAPWRLAPGADLLGDERLGARWRTLRATGPPHVRGGPAGDRAEPGHVPRGGA
jgi:hypothetical protein